MNSKPCRVLSNLQIGSKYGALLEYCRRGTWTGFIFNAIGGGRGFVRGWPLVPLYPCHQPAHEPQKRESHNRGTTRCNFGAPRTHICLLPRHATNPDTHLNLDQSIWITINFHFIEKSPSSSGKIPCMLASNLSSSESRLESFFLQICHVISS